MKVINYYATFYSPGTFFCESSTVKLKGFDVIEALKKAKSIKERHGATPYGFVLEEKEEGSVTEGKDTYKMEPKTKKESGTYFITGTVMTLKDVPDTKENRTLRSNMESNGYNAVVENRNSWKITLPFEKNDILIDWDGNVLDKGKNYSKK